MKVTMDKLKIYFKIYLRYHTTYKANVMLKLVHLPINTFVIGMMWYVLYQTNEQLDLRYLIYYYICVFLITNCYPFARVVRNIEGEIFYGKVVTYFVRPVPYFIPKWMHFISWIVIYFSLSLPIFIILLFLSNIKIINFVSFFIVLLVGLNIQFLFWYLIALFSFWLEKIIGLLRAVSVVQTICSGALIPLFMFSENVQKIIDLLPFKYFVFYPVNLLLQDVDGYNLLSILISEFLWILLLIFMIQVLWNIGLRHYQNNFN
ncbi:ABC transporter permease [Fervidibacillus albus]|uniref:ABC-2 family transporter protein n=1 Tax=Fervidibacillus albus TaxID=2980026 RepID=A0A9E8LUE0_9BACI|nr:ABC-2 family transporter protein [Fervidibacillus albus]WAA09852.1 ABC-2 family transporter protein [Fervidibacillus albus]